MDIRLNTFITLAEIKSYTKAAEVLNITQPAVSQHIRFLEEWYGVQLFKRRGRILELTDEGKVLLKYAREISILYRSAEMEIKNKSGISKTYNIGASMTIGGYVLPDILAKYKKAHRNVTMLMQVGNTEEIIEKLLNRRLDFAIVEGPFDRRRFIYKKLKDDELVLAVSPLHDFSKMKQVDIVSIVSGELIQREAGSGTRKIFEEKLVELGYDIKDIKSYMEVGSISAIKALVESNMGYTIISKETIKKELGMGTIKTVPIKNIRIFREFNYIYLTEKQDTFIDEFMDFCVKNI